jgi:hypothetical protein
MAMKVSPQLARMGVEKFVNEVRGGRTYLRAVNSAGVYIEGIRPKGMQCWSEKKPSVDQAIAHIEAAVALFKMEKDQVERLSKDIEIGQFTGQTPKW